MKRTRLAIGLVTLVWSSTAAASEPIVPIDPLREAYFGETQGRPPGTHHRRGVVWRSREGRG